MIITEIELRGPLTEQQATQLLGLAAKANVPVKKQNRMFLDYSTFLEGIAERTKDIRIRRTNGELEMNVKVGQFGGLAARKEAGVRIVDSLKHATDVYALLGFTKAAAGDRRSRRFVVDDIEVAIIEVWPITPGPKEGGTAPWGLFYEIEWMGAPLEEHVVVKKLTDFAAQHGLGVYSKDQWAEFSLRMNSEPNTVFEHGVTDIALLEPLGQAA